LKNKVRKRFSFELTDLMKAIYQLASPQRLSGLSLLFAGCCGRLCGAEMTPPPIAAESSADYVHFWIPVERLCGEAQMAMLPKPEGLILI
jgi:hypothetical protein